MEHIREYLEGDRLRTVWQGLDDLQKAAVAEVVHSSDTTFPAERFRAKYGRLPDFGAVSRWPRDQPPTALRFFFYAIERGGGVMPDDLKERLEAFVPPPLAATVKSLDELPAAYDRPFERWNTRTKKEEQGTEPIPLTVRETERSAQRELLSVLRLVDAGKVAVSDKTRRASSATIDAITAVLEGGEAQRLGRILRPKSDGRAAHFFSLVSRDTREEDFAHHRKLFLTEQGYSYQVRLADRA